MNSQFQGNNPLSNSDISQLECKLGFALPHEYREFLQRQNGGSFTGEYPEVKATSGESFDIDCLFGYGLARAADIVFWRCEMAADIPANSLLIAKDSSGGFFVLLFGSSDSGVYYYDHGQQISSSSIGKNAYKICDNFTQFKTMIGIP